MNIENEIKKWDSKVFYPDERFKESTLEAYPQLKEYLYESKEKFITISAETENVVYKIGRYFVESGVPMRSIKFLDGDTLSIYVNVRENNINIFLNYLNTLKLEVKEKWVLIPRIDNEWNKIFMSHFMTFLQNNKAIGLIFYSDEKLKNNNFGSLICNSVGYNVLEYPKQKFYLGEKRQLPKDDY